ncbi:hypothetical protein LWI28_018613 [Acer negundo]|uniref:Uncharacterized protein n=1 Tax=Acer negundo TaxID=4023 RepID=A0AAD5JDW3_ACENE|nr:hypothetical protein LWI28_018613 [Acer negundo]
MLSKPTRIRPGSFLIPSPTKLDRNCPSNQVTINQVRFTRITDTFRCFCLVHQHVTSHASFPKKSIVVTTTTGLQTPPQKNKETKLYVSRTPANRINNINEILVQAANTKVEIGQRDRFLKKVYCTLGAELLLGALVYRVSEMFPPVAAAITQNFQVFSAIFGIGSFCTIVPLGAVLAALSGKMVAASVISTLAMVFALKWFTFWASKKGHDAFYLPIFIFVCMIVVQIAKHLQMKNPNPITFTLNTGLGIPVYLGSIICDTDELLNRYQEDDYAFHSFCLHVKISNLFFRIMEVLIVLYDYQNMEIIQMLQKLHKF